jgi:hypothetical protein
MCRCGVVATMAASRAGWVASDAYRVVKWKINARICRVSCRNKPGVSPVSGRAPNAKNESAALTASGPVKRPCAAPRVPPRRSQFARLVRSQLSTFHRRSAHETVYDIETVGDFETATAPSFTAFSRFSSADSRLYPIPFAPSKSVQPDQCPCRRGRHSHKSTPRRRRDFLCDCDEGDVADYSCRR